MVDCLPEGSWYRDFMDCFPLAEAPKSYILFSAMAMAGSCIGRKSWFDQDIHRVYPIMSLLLIGPSGIGKSTSMRDIALNNLIRTLPEEIKPQVISGKTTKEALHADLVAQPHSLIMASELANMFSKEKYMEGMIPYVTDLLDLTPTSVRTKSGGLQTIREPSVAIIGGSTREWLQEQLPSTATAGGFLPRFFIIKEDYKFQRIANPEGMLSKTQKIALEEKRIKTFRSFIGMVDFHRGNVSFKDHEASDAYTVWYQTFTPETGTLSPFAARAGVHILRIAMLLAFSCARSVISAEDINSAICLFSYSMSKLQEVIVPMSAQGKLISKVLECVGAERLSLAAIKRAMRNYCGRRDVEEAISSLVEAGDITCTDGLYKRTNI